MKVLAAEDNPVFQTLLASMLTKWGYEVLSVGDGNEAWEMLQSDDSLRMVILDWMMPGIDGVELCRRIRAAAREPYIYILLLTARTESQDLIEGMDAGADDYLTKPFNTQELRVRLRAGRRILELQEELLEAREALRIQATHDCLTGILNRASILERLRNELSRGAREKQSTAVLLLDLDHFKQVNDTRGHMIGDAVLREATQRMKSAIRRYDSVGRYGGEEFLVVLPVSSDAEASQVAERVRQAVASEPYRAGNDSFSVTCSIGLCWRKSPYVHDADQMVREADTALYQAKNRGRNCVEVAFPADAA